MATGATAGGTVAKASGTTTAGPPATAGNRDPLGLVGRAYAAFTGYSSPWGANPTQSYDAWAAEVAPVPASTTPGANVAPFGYAPTGRRPDASLLLSLDDTADGSSPNGGLAGAASKSDKAGFYAPGDTQSGIAAAATKSAASKDPTLVAKLNGIVDAEAACDARGPALAFVASTSKSVLAKRQASDWWNYELPGLIADGMTTSIDGVSMLSFKAVEGELFVSRDERTRVEDAMAQAGQRTLDPRDADPKAASVPLSTRVLAAAQTLVSGVFGRTMTNHADQSAPSGLVTAKVGAGLLSDVVGNGTTPYTNPTDASVVMQVHGEAAFAGATAVTRGLAFLELASREGRGLLPTGSAAAVGDAATLMASLGREIPTGATATVADDEGDLDVVTVGRLKDGVTTLSILDANAGARGGTPPAPTVLVEVAGAVKGAVVVPDVTVQAPGASGIVRDDAGGNVIDETATGEVTGPDGKGAVKMTFDVVASGDAVNLGKSTSFDPTRITGDRDVVTGGHRVLMTGNDDAYRGTDASDWFLEVKGERATVSGTRGFVTVDAGSSVTCLSDQATYVASGAHETVAGGGGGGVAGAAYLWTGSDVTVDLSKLGAGGTSGGGPLFGIYDGIDPGTSDYFLIDREPTAPDGRMGEYLVHYVGSGIASKTALANPGTLNIRFDDRRHWIVDGRDLGRAAVTASTAPTPAPTPPTTPTSPTPPQTAPVATASTGTVLTGGVTSHDFVFSAAPGRTVVTDFRASGPQPDTLDFAKATFGTPQAALAAAIQRGDDVVVGVDAKDSVTLLHTQLSTLTASAFKLH